MQKKLDMSVGIEAHFVSQSFDDARTPESANQSLHIEGVAFANPEKSKIDAKIVLHTTRSNTKPRPS